MFSKVLEHFFLPQECSGGGKSLVATAQLKPDPARGASKTLHWTLLKVFPSPRRQGLYLREVAKGLSWVAAVSSWHCTVKRRAHSLGRKVGQGQPHLHRDDHTGRPHPLQVPCRCSVLRSSGQPRSSQQKNSYTSFPRFSGLKFWVGFFCWRWKAVAVGSPGSGKIAGRR